VRSYDGIMNPRHITKATNFGGLLFSSPSFFQWRAFIATQYEIPFKLSINTVHVSVMAITPAMASHKVRHASW
jgi:hypothetical protein